MMGIPLADKILEVLKSGLSAWEKYIDTRQEAYERKMDKNKRKALNIAEKSFEEVALLFEWVRETFPMSDDELKEYNKLNKKFTKIKEKFNKYD